MEIVNTLQLDLSVQNMDLATKEELLLYALTHPDEGRELTISYGKKLYKG